MHTIYNMLRWGILMFSVLFSCSTAQNSGYWQQRVEYDMNINFDVLDHQFSGEQSLTYYNNSPDTLNRAFYYLFFNAFQPNSMMDVRSRTIPDPDGRVGDRIVNLTPEEQGYQKIISLTQDGTPLAYEVVGTILEVELAEPLLPGKSSVFEMTFEGQVPIQIRRSGRDSREGVDYTMTQWYPKMCEYDREGWHANPYIAREFHGVWGDYDVRITIDSSYVVAGSGILQNPEACGHGYDLNGKSLQRPDSDQLTWHFIAENVHDFAWGADRDYAHDIIQIADGPVVHFFYQPENEEIEQNWKELQSYTRQLFQIMNETFGKYPYPTYSVVQGGDGGMEYAMLTMITGGRNLGGLVSVTVHEVIHSWFQMVLGTNEAKYSWMDEGYTSYAGAYVKDIMYEKNALNPIAGSYNGYRNLVLSGLEEPSSTHSDHYMFNRAYSAAAYSKGAVSLHQLSYIIGKSTFFDGMKRYFNTWKFKHPEPRDFKRVMEKESGLELDWYYEYWIHSTKFINYSVDSVWEEGGKSYIQLANKGLMPMPIDLVVTYADESKELFYMPLRMMRGEKNDDFYEEEMVVTLEEDWPWVNPTYVVEIDKPLSDILEINIDPSLRMADLDRNDNVWKKGDDETSEGSSGN